MKVLGDIQAVLKAPKGQTNEFGKFKYRSCEDILEAVKPILAEKECVLTIADEMVVLGDRFYVKATATLSCGKDSIATTAFARESETKSGMDAAQITGAASSYARKYALNGLFCIDDTKDADTNEHKIATEAPDADLAIAIDDIKRAKDLAELQKMWTSWKGYQGYPQFKAAKDARKAELSA
ncbi:MAG: ERF family protein [Rikenellaceae bacterium]